MRFGAFVPQGWRLDLLDIPQEAHWPTMLGVAKAIETSGYESLWVFDHFHTVPIPTQEVTYEAWTLMAALAAGTDRVRLGQMCTCNGYRNPAYLAKVAACVDVISGGRVEMGIGAGWYEHEFVAYGYEFPAPSVRLGQLREAVEIMRRLWTEEAVHHDGRYYKIDGAICSPRGVQEPHIPIWVAGDGERLTLNIAARHAQYTNFGDTVDEFLHKSRVLADHCRDVGRDVTEITRSTNFTMVCAATEAAVAELRSEALSKYRRFVSGDRIGRIERGWLRIAGTPEQLVAELRPWKDAGLDYAIVSFVGAAYDTSGLELFAREVIPALG